jgi:hypothetical protein
MEIKILTVCSLNSAQNQFTLPYFEILSPSLYGTRLSIEFRFAETLIVWPVAMEML